MRDFSRSVARWSLVAVGALLLFLVGMLLFSPMLHVREIRVVRRDLRTDVERVKSSLAPLFGRHLLFLNPLDVRVLLKEKIMDIDDVAVFKQYPSTLAVELSLDPLAARLHFGEVQQRDQMEATGTVLPLDFLTSEGMYVRYHHAPDQAAYRDLPLIYLTDWGIRPAIGNHLIDPALLERIGEASDLLSQQFGYEIRKRTIFLRSREFHILLDNFSLWFDMRNSVDAHLRRYKIFLNAVPLDRVREYVDLRLSGKVVYR